MTGNLNAMMHMHDLQVAENIGKMAELGWFDVEFTVYGCAYMLDGQMRYRISSEAKDIYTYIENGVAIGVYPGNVLSLTKKYPVPAGMKALIAQEVKRDLGKILKEVYPKAFFETLYLLAEEALTNSAAPLLWSEVKRLEGVFEEDQLKSFERLVKYAYSCRKLLPREYELLLGWIASERKDMEDDFSNKDIFEKTLYGIGYEEEGKIAHLVNARKEYIYQQQHDLEQGGKLTTPLFSETYWYNYSYRLLDVNQDFKQKIKQELNEAYISKIKQIRQGTNTLGQAEFSIRAEAVKKQYGQKPYETMLRYGHRWGIMG